MAEQTFVHGDTEVKKTGRIARKAMPSGKDAILVEITPLSEGDGTWKKFVPPGALFAIDDPRQNQVNKP